MRTIKINWFFKISKIAVFLLLLLFLNPRQYVMAEWHWGTENCSQNDYPEGLVGGFFFQYGNGWTDNATCKFEGWDKERELHTALCFLGSITTIFLYHEWPKESHFSGNWGNDEIRIDHVWKYVDIKDLTGGIGNWYQDDPEKREISGCTITGYCSAADEIRRLYGAVNVALNIACKDWAYGCVFDKATNCIPDLLTRFGYQLEAFNAWINDRTQLSESNKQKLIDSLKNGDPVIVVGNGHVWVLDDYRDENGGEFHILNYGCSSIRAHKAYWITDPTSDGGHYEAKAYIYNIRPKVDHKVPEAAFRADENTGYAPFTVRFSDKSIGDITSWNWEFGDGKVSTKQNPSHKYQSEGSFAVSLTVANESGSDTMTKKDFIVVRKKEEVVKWEEGDVFVGGVGMLKIYDNSGVLKEKLDIPQLGLPICGYNNVTNKLYITDWNNDKLYIYAGKSPHNNVQIINLGSSIICDDCKHTKGIVFAVNRDFYVGHSEGKKPIYRFSSTDGFQGIYNVATEGSEGGADFLSLSADQKTMYYTSRGERIMRYNVVDKLQLTDYANISGQNLRDLVLLPPDGKGGLIVAQSDEIKRLDINGKVVKSYNAPGISNWFTLALDPNGTSFWALSSSGGGKICRFNIQKGKIEVGPINTMLSPITTALCVKGAPIVSLPKKQILTPEKDIVKFEVIEWDYDDTPLEPPLKAGTFIFTAQLTNTTDNLLVYAPIRAVVTRLEYKDYPSLPPEWIQLITATEGDGTVGSKQDIKVGQDDILMPHESVKVEFRIGLQQRSRFFFYVVLECFTF